MRVTDRRGIEYEVIFDADRGLYVYMKVFNPSADLDTVSQSSPSSTHSQTPVEPSHRHA